jgi:hypothetical protein
MLDDDYISMSKQKCTACGEIKEHHDHWWLFVSSECYDCESKIESILPGQHPMEDGGEPF